VFRVVRTERARQLRAICRLLAISLCVLLMSLSPTADALAEEAAEDMTAAAAPSFGPLTLSVTAEGVVTSAFTLSTSEATTFSSVRVALRSTSNSSLNDGRLDFGHVPDVTLLGSRTFTMGISGLTAGHYEARPAYQLDGRWVNGGSVVTFSTAWPAGTTAQPGQQSVGSASGFAPGGDFPYLSDGRLARELDAVRSAGAGWVRVDFPWVTVEPSPGVFRWNDLDRTTEAAAQRGIKVLAMPAYAPAWARPGCGTLKCPPADPDDFARFVAEAGRRYGPDRVQAWEIWNEPNIPTFWHPRPSPDAYATLLDRAAAALKAARPGAYVVSAGLSPAYSDGTAVAPLDFVNRLYALEAMENVDAVGMHPYSATLLPLTPSTEAWNTFLQMESVHKLMNSYGDGHKQVWGTEFGVATGTSRTSTSEAQQAAVIEEGYARLADGSWPWLGTLFTYSLRDRSSDLGDRQSNYGLLRHDGSPKPAYLTFAAKMREPLVR
jgi:hypothetical protein